MKKTLVFTAVLALTLLGLQHWIAGTRALAARDPLHRGAPVSEGDSYPYREAQFTQFVADSYSEQDAGDPETFYRWFEKAYHDSSVRCPGHEQLTLQQLLVTERESLAKVADPAARAHQEVELAAWLHGAVKKLIPRFSLERGFEFRNVPVYGERQCFLQSVLTAGLLQAMKVNAGVAMVYRNPKGQVSNLGHAVTLIKLPDNRDVLMDCSEPEPFAEHQGLFVRAGGYRYVQPVYRAGAEPGIVAYRAEAGGAEIPVKDVAPLDVRFLRSQFDYYRGERAPGGLTSKPTPEGLQLAARYLNASLESCPQNPLAVYTLGRVYLRLGDTASARRYLAEADRLYGEGGWRPDGVRDFLARSGG